MHFSGHSPTNKPKPKDNQLSRRRDSQHQQPPKKRIISYRMETTSLASQLRRKPDSTLHKAAEAADYFAPINPRTTAPKSLQPSSSSRSPAATYQYYHTTTAGGCLLCTTTVPHVPISGRSMQERSRRQTLPGRAGLDWRPAGSRGKVSKSGVRCGESCGDWGLRAEPGCLPWVAVSGGVASTIAPLPFLTGAPRCWARRACP